MEHQQTHSHLLAEQAVKDFTALLASDAPAPGGGSAAALEGAMGAALTAMVCELTLGKEKYAAYREEIAAIRDKAETLREKLLQAMDEDTEAFLQVSRAFAMAKATDEEKAAGIAENIVAIDGIAVVTDPSNTVEDLTKQQLTDIYTGTITNWSEVGGESMPIVVVGREAGSGTRSAFEELLEIEDACKYANELDSTGAVMAKVASTPGAIGYVSLDVLDDTVKALKLEGAEPTEENIKAGSYFLSRPFVMATKGEIAEQNDLVKALFDYIYSDEGSEIVKSVGLITVEQ